MIAELFQRLSLCFARIKIFIWLVRFAFRIPWIFCMKFFEKSEERGLKIWCWGMLADDRMVFGCRGHLCAYNAWPGSKFRELSAGPEPLCTPPFTFPIKSTNDHPDIAWEYQSNPLKIHHERKKGILSCWPRLWFRAGDLLSNRVSPGHAGGLGRSSRKNRHLAHLQPASEDGFFHCVSHADQPREDRQMLPQDQHCELLSRESA